VTDTCQVYGVSQRRACGLFQANRSTYHYKSRKKSQAALRVRILDIARARPRFGYLRIHALLRREGWLVNRKRVHRLYVEEGLQVRTRRRKKVASHVRVPLPAPRGVNEAWSMDFVADRLENGRKLRMLTIVDQFSRECVMIEPDHALTSHRVVACLDRLKAVRGLPQSITVDNGTEFDSNAVDAWAYFNKVKMQFIRPGKPTENAFIESFNGRLRDEFLNAHVFETMEEVRQKVEVWKLDYNQRRPHGSLGYFPPEEFARRAKVGLQEGKKLNLEVAQKTG